MQTTRAVLTSLVWLVATLGCASQPALDTSTGTERSFDGLYPINNTIVDRAWARGDLDLSGYSRIKLEGAGIQFRPTRASASSRFTHTRAGETDFPIDEKNRQRLRDTVRDAFVKELAKLKNFAITDEVGPDVLIVRGTLLDVVSNVPPERAQRSDIYLASVGEATLALELVDAQSGTVLLRAVDRRAAESTGQLFKSNRASNWVEVRRLAQFWARLLRDRLDALAESMTLREDAV